MLFGIVLMFVILQENQWTMAVNMCTNQSSSNKDVALNLVPETGVSGCNCSVKLTKTDNLDSIRSKIIFETVQFSDCKYKLVTSYNNTNSIISCSNNNSVFYDINKSDEIKLYLESNVPSQDETTTFEVRITSSITSIGGPLILIECFSPTVKSTTNSVIITPNITDEPLTTSTTVTTQRSTTKPVQPQATSTTITTQRSTTKPVQPQATSTTVTTQRSTTKPVQPQPTSTADYIPTTQRTSTPSSITSTPDTISPIQVYLTTSSTSSSKTGSTRRDDDDADGCDDDDVFVGVIGGVIGGVIVGVSILIIMCILKYRKRSKKSSSEIYSTPQHHLPESQYTDLQIIQHNNDHN